MTLQIGDTAPDFEVKNQNGEPVKLSSFRGQKVVLVLLPERRHFRLHCRGLQHPRQLRCVSKSRLPGFRRKC